MWLKSFDHARRPHYSDVDSQHLYDAHKRRVKTMRYTGHCETYSDIVVLRFSYELQRVQKPHKSYVPRQF